MLYSTIWSLKLNIKSFLNWFHCAVLWLYYLAHCVYEWPAENAGSVPPPRRTEGPQQHAPQVALSGYRAESKKRDTVLWADKVLKMGAAAWTRNNTETTNSTLQCVLFSLNQDKMKQNPAPQYHTMRQYTWEDIYQRLMRSSKHLRFNYWVNTFALPSGKKR